MNPASYPSIPEIYLDQEEIRYSLPPLHGKQSICYGNPFSPLGGSCEWNNNELLLKDPCIRKLAYVNPLDTEITALYYKNPVPKI